MVFNCLLFGRLFLILSSVPKDVAQDISQRAESLQQRPVENASTRERYSSISLADILNEPVSRRLFNDSETACPPTATTSPNQVKQTKKKRVKISAHTLYL